MCIISAALPEDPPITEVRHVSNQCTAHRQTLGIQVLTQYVGLRLILYLYQVGTAVAYQVRCTWSADDDSVGLVV